MEQPSGFLRLPPKLQEGQDFSGESIRQLQDCFWLGAADFAREADVRGRVVHGVRGVRGMKGCVNDFSRAFLQFFKLGLHEALFEVFVKIFYGIAP